jgi:hypothetical protein
MAPLCGEPRRGAIGKQAETFQKKSNGLSPAVTFTHHPLNAYGSCHSMSWQAIRESA